ncbi:MAG: NAD-dependent epimerase/dehydratase family protein [Candidatus Aminicenantaceae bacterium]
MRVFIVGGTGFLGSHLVPRLIQKNHHVTVLTRDKTRIPTLKQVGAAGIVGDILDPDSFVSHLVAPDFIINIAMPPVRPGRISKRRFIRLRGETTLYISHTIQLAEKIGCPYILTLGTSFHSDTGRVFTEADPIQRFGMTKIGEQVDELIDKALGNDPPRCIVFMPGQIYGPGGLFLMMYEWMKKGRFRIAGKGDNIIPRIHVEDLADAYVKAVEKRPCGERFILADDTPCTMREFTEYMAECMQIPTPKSIPRQLMRIIIGRLLVETITMNCRVSNAKAKRVLEWQPEYPSYRDGLKRTMGELRDS